MKGNTLLNGWCRGRGTAPFPCNPIPNTNKQNQKQTWSFTQKNGHTRALQAELTDHLGFEKHDPAGHGSGNSRNGMSRKTLKGDLGDLELETPRDRQASL